MVTLVVVGWWDILSVLLPACLSRSCLHNVNALTKHKDLVVSLCIKVIYPGLNIFGLSSSPIRWAEHQIMVVTKGWIICGHAPKFIAWLLLWSVPPPIPRSTHAFSTTWHSDCLSLWLPDPSWKIELKNCSKQLMNLNIKKSLHHSTSRFSLLSCVRLHDPFLALSFRCVSSYNNLSSG